MNENQRRTSLKKIISAMKRYCLENRFEGLEINVKRKFTKDSIGVDWETEHQILDKVPDKPRNLNEDKIKVKIKK